MWKRLSRLMALAVMVGSVVYLVNPGDTQEPPPVASEALPPPQGVDVLARGPVHEAFATPFQEPKQTPGIPKKPPVPIDEMPPAERPVGDAVWIGGYWAWDDDRADFLWVSGCWRVKPAGKDWVPGYWREVGNVWQWVPGFWANANSQQAQPVSYYPQPPAPPNVAPPGDPPIADSFYIPGYWMWNGAGYSWRAGYWTRVRPGYVYIPSHYQWTPSGYAFIPGYWDMTVSRRGVLYAPIAVNAAIVGPNYVYTPYYAVRDTMVLDTMFVRVSFGSYYFGDYYGPRYAAIGFEPAIVYSRRHYEPLIVYERWDRRGDPRWYNTQISLVVARGAGRAPVPPRVINVRNVTVVNNYVAPTRTILAAQGQKAVALTPAARAQVRAAAQHTQRTVALDRHKAEAAAARAGPVTRPHTSAHAVPAAKVTAHPNGFGPHPPPPLGTHPAGPPPHPLKANPALGPGRKPPPRPVAPAREPARKGREETKKRVP